MTWKVLLTDGLEDSGKDILKASTDVVDQPTITPEDLLKVAGEYDAIIVRGRTKIIPAVFDAASKLKVVGRSGVGVDNIDLAAAKNHGVVVVNAPIATTLAVAELTMGLLFSLAREIPRADAGMKNTKWLKKELEGIELNGKTLGVIGFGRIGSAVAQRSAAMGMKIIVSDPAVTETDVRAKSAEPVSIDELYKRSDFITVHTPLTNETRGIINADGFAKMKNGVRIVCAARGGVIDEMSLLEALNSGKVGGAALDVFATEPPGESALASHPRVVATPHVGAQTKEAQSRAAADIATEVLAALDGSDLRWRVA